MCVFRTLVKNTLHAITLVLQYVVVFEIAVCVCVGGLSIIKKRNEGEDHIYVHFDACLVRNLLKYRCLDACSVRILLKYEI